MALQISFRVDGVNSLCRAGWWAHSPQNPGHMVAVWWIVSWQRIPRAGLLTLAWPFTIFRLHRNPRLDELKHFIIVHFNVGWVLFCGVNLDTECVCVCVVLWRGRWDLCDWFTKCKARAFSPAALTQKWTQSQSVCHLCCVHYWKNTMLKINRANVTYTQLCFF